MARESATNYLVWPSYIDQIKTDVCWRIMVNGANAKPCLPCQLVYIFSYTFSLFTAIYIE